MTDTELADYRIHDLESFNRTTGEGHEVAGLYLYQQLDCLVDLAYRVAWTSSTGRTCTSMSAG